MELNGLITLAKKISLLGLEINYYSLFMFLAVYYCWKTINDRINQVYHRKNKEIENLLIVAIVGGIIGARFWYVFSNLENYASNWFNVFAVWQGGIAIHGAIVGGFLSGYVYWKKKKYSSNFNIWVICDLIFPVILIGQFIGRWGNFYNQEIYGFPISKDLTSLLIALLFNFEMILAIIILFIHKKGFKNFFKKENKYYFEWILFVYLIYNIINFWLFGFNDFILKWMNINSQYRLPLFLVEGSLNLILHILIITLAMKKNFKGKSIGLYLIGYGVVRGILEPLRNQVDIMKIWGIYVSVIVSIIFFVFGALVLYYQYKKSKGVT